jgi:hypothetical protein
MWPGYDSILQFLLGTYVVSKPIVQYYYTQVIGDTLKPVTRNEMGKGGGDDKHRYLHGQQFC